MISNPQTIKAMKCLFLKFSLIFIIFVASCTKDKAPKFITYNNIDMVTCGNSNENEELYRLSEIYFNNNEMLTFRLRIVYFTNGVPTLDTVPLIKQVIQINNFFSTNNAKLNFKLIGIEFVNKLPGDDPSIIPFLQDVERIKNKSRPIQTLREGYKMEHFRFWHTLYGVDDAITMYIYEGNNYSNIAGQAGGIGSNFFAVQSKFCSILYNTAAHELAHCLSLLHTQTHDDTNGFSNYTGDGICDTPSSPSLLGLIGENCNLRDHWEEMIEVYGSSNEGNDYSILKRLTKEQFDVLTHNIMGYSNPICRTSFTEQQIRRMRKSVETSADLRKCVIGMEEYNIDVLESIN